ncbi:hypothetical protein AB6A40_009596 [Gnathostoma spinigerum]|uniref:DUF7808 domain-containing protein n=1 Tax=Gnathostoma spinigerum TaxID=75299 RepID=A0ABD6EUV2_9BILA
MFCRSSIVTIFAAFAIFSYDFGFAHRQFRKLVCLTKDRSYKAGNETAKCQLFLKDTEEEEPGRAAALNAGCFSERENATSERVWCNLFCPNAHTVFHTAFDLFHRSCFNYFNYQLVEKNDDWFVTIFKIPKSYGL